jgi:hypothetical protein
MNKIDLQRMFNYHYWAHRRVWDCVMTVVYLSNGAPYKRPVF